MAAPFYASNKVSCLHIEEPALQLKMQDRFFFRSLKARGEEIEDCLN